ncbi:hypothetical protein [Parathermosynechococcus lividus]|uniref:hypothetical protein n=1 Tax=Parathermosynechococcus lividus TaxID=33070 RepID=UPI0018E0A011|nr:hypothetical protein [Thermostichus lividus]
MIGQRLTGAIAVGVLLGGCQSAMNRLDAPAVARPEREGWRLMWQLRSWGN